MMTYDEQVRLPEWVKKGKVAAPRPWTVGGWHGYGVEVLDANGNIVCRVDVCERVTKPDGGPRKSDTWRATEEGLARLAAVIEVGRIDRERAA